MTDKRSQQETQTPEAKQIAGYPEKPISRWLLGLAVAACVLWLCFLVAMVIVRQIEWPI